MRALSRSMVFLSILSCLAARPAAAQGEDPLHKSDLVRMLAAGNPTGPELAARIRRDCLAFAPTDRDRDDLRSAGADSAVMDAIAGCATRPPQRTGRLVGELRISAPEALRAYTGTHITITARAFRGTSPQPGLAVELRGARAIPGGTNSNLRTFTDIRGAATFRVATGTRTGTYRLEVGVAGDPAGPRATIVLTTVTGLTIMPTPDRRNPLGAGLRAEVRPAEVVVRSGTRTGHQVDVLVRDAQGNPARGILLSFKGLTADVGAIPETITDMTGTATFTIPAAAVARGGLVGVFRGGLQLAVVMVRLQNILLSAERTRFIEGTDQRGAVHTRLRQPLVLEVRDTAGAPVPDYPVAFTATNGDVDPAVANTDSAGLARVWITLGDKAAPALFTATVGRVSRRATLYAEPGFAQLLVVERNGVPVTSSLVLQSLEPVTLRVVARDAYGNDTRLLGLNVLVEGGAVRLEPLRGAAALGTVVVLPRRSGKAELDVLAAGLETRVPVEVALPRIGGGGGEATWVLGARLGGAAFYYDFKALPNINGDLGVRAELEAARRLATGFKLGLGAGFGKLHADTGFGPQVSVTLLQGYVRGEYAFFPESRVVPLVSLGTGIYRLKSSDPRHAVYHTSLFWLAGVGLNIPMSPTLVGEVHLETQRLYEASSSIVNGFVGSLTVFQAGLRFTP